MTKAIALIVKSTDTFEVWVDKTNELANVASQEMFTSNTDANGSVTPGNAQHTGIISANTLGIVGFLRGGNVQTTETMNVSSNVIIMTGNTLTVGNTTANVEMTETEVNLANTTVTYAYILPTAVQKAANTFNLNANGSWVDSSVGAQVETSGTSAQEIDTWLLADFYSMEYTATVNDNNANNRQISKLLVLQDGGAYITEYGITQSNSAMGEYTANANSTAVRVFYTPASTNTFVKFHRLPTTI